MKEFFNPKSITIIGASNAKGKIGNILIQNISQNKKIKIFPVNPKRSKINKLKTYSSVLDIEDQVDLAIIAIPAEFVAKAVEECAWKAQPIKNIIIISAGFSEIGKEGRKKEEKLKRLAEEHDLKILGPNCLGAINVSTGFNASFAKNELHPGSIGLIMQSGAMTTALFDLAKSENLGFSLVTTLGNKSVITENDAIDYYLKDENIKILALYLEDIKDGKEFQDLLQKANRKKPVVIIKAGASQRTQSAIQSHTGAMAGEIDVFKEVATENGAFFCNNIRDFVGILKLLDGFRISQSNSVVIVTNAGGPGVVTTDLIENSKNLELQNFSEQKKRELKKFLPQAGSANNPIDVLGDATEDRYEKTLKVLLKDKELGAILVLVTPQAQTPVKKIAIKIARLNSKSVMPILPIVIGANAQEEAREIFNKTVIKNFSYPVEAVRALDQISITTKRASDRVKLKTNKQRMVKAKKMLSNVHQEKRKVLYYHEAQELTNLYDINIVTAHYLESESELSSLSLEYPVVAKIDDPEVLHKNAKDGLVLNIKDELELEVAYAKLSGSFPQSKILVQRQLESGLELIMGLKNDKIFGPVLMFGLGGITTEIFDEKLLWVLPTSKNRIARKIKRSALGKVIEKEKINLDEVAENLEKIAQLGNENPKIKELDVNPIIFYPSKKPIAVDVKVILSALPED